jgi:hypothetical protein
MGIATALYSGSDNHKGMAVTTVWQFVSEKVSN